MSPMSPDFSVTYLPDRSVERSVRSHLLCKKRSAIDRTPAALDDRCCLYLVRRTGPTPLPGAQFARLAGPPQLCEDCGGITTPLPNSPNVGPARNIGAYCLHARIAAGEP